MTSSFSPKIFNVYKPKGFSSFDIVRHFKKNLNYDFGKIGHFGTLDPFAEGVLLIGVQGAQKLNDFIHEHLPKTYRACGKFGIQTRTGDLTGEIIEERDIAPQWREASKDVIELELSGKFCGDYWQSPHPVSAVKFEGKSLYKHALEGKIIVKEKVKRKLFDLKIIEYHYPHLKFEVSVSSGTYVRSLFEDFSQVLGGCGHLVSLERTKIGPISSLESMQQHQWPSKSLDFHLSPFALSVEQVLQFNKIGLTQQQTYAYFNGIRLNVEDVELKCCEVHSHSNDYFWIQNPQGVTIGLAQLVINELHSKIIWPLLR